MADPIISVANLSKRYVIGHLARHDTLRDALAHGARGLWSLLRRGRDGGPPKREDFWALRDISFEVERGEVLGIIGRNGAGKSTLLKILSRITEPTTGRIAIRGRVASLLEVGTGFHPELSGRENIFLNGAILGMRREEIRRKFDEIVAFAEVEQFLDTPVKRYSSGMYVRLAFAVAAHLEPEILVVDEVLAVGDAQFQAKSLGKMESVAHSGRTILFVSHNMASIERLCTRALHLRQGRLAGAGRPRAQIIAYLGAGARPADRVRTLAGAPRSSDLRGGVRLETVQLATDEVPAPWQLPFGAPLRLAILAKIVRPLASWEVGIGIFNLQGQEILSTLSSWQDDPGPLQPGRYEFSVDYGTVELVPGHYRLGIGLKSERGLEDYVADGAEFEIVPASAGSRATPTGIHGAIARLARFSVKPA